MEDVRTDVVTSDWPTYIKDNFNNLNNGRDNIVNGGSNSAKLGNTRRSMDNLLKVDTSYGRGFQVRLSPGAKDFINLGITLLCGDLIQIPLLRHAGVIV